MMEPSVIGTSLIVRRISTFPHSLSNGNTKLVFNGLAQRESDYSPVFG